MGLSHGGLRQKMFNAYEETIRVPFVVSSPLFPGGARELDIPPNHADLIPTLLGLAGIDQDRTLTELRESHAEARPLVGRDLSTAIRAAVPTAPADTASMEWSPCLVRIPASCLRLPT